MDSNDVISVLPKQPPSNELLNHPPTRDVAVFKPSPSGATRALGCRAYKPATSLVRVI